MALKKETELSGWLCCTRPTEPCSFGFVSRKGTVVLFPSFSGRSCSTGVTCQGQDLNYAQDFLKPRAIKTPGFLSFAARYLPSRILATFPPFPEPLWEARSRSAAKNEQTTGKRARFGWQDAVTECPASTPICTANRSSFPLCSRCWDLDRGGFSRSFGVGTEGGRWAMGLRGGCCLLPASFGHQKWAGIMV